MDQRRVLW